MSEEIVDVEALSFREAMAELDGIVSLLERNTLVLEDSLERYERGIKLLASLQRRLAHAQQRVDVLAGELVVESDDATTDSTLS